MTTNCKHVWVLDDCRDVGMCLSCPVCGVCRGWEDISLCDDCDKRDPINPMLVADPEDVQ